MPNAISYISERVNTDKYLSQIARCSTGYKRFRLVTRLHSGSPAGMLLLEADE